MSCPSGTHLLNILCDTVSSVHKAVLLHAEVKCCLKRKHLCNCSSSYVNFSLSTSHRAPLWLERKTGRPTVVIQTWNLTVFSQRWMKWEWHFKENWQLLPKIKAELWSELQNFGKFVSITGNLTAFLILKSAFWWAWLVILKYWWFLKILYEIERNRRRGWQRMRWLDGITDSMDMSLSKLWGIIKAREAWWLQSMAFKELDTT